MTVLKLSTSLQLCCCIAVGFQNFKFRNIKINECSLSSFIVINIENIVPNFVI